MKKVISYALCGIVGYAIGRIAHRTPKIDTFGVLRVDKSEEDEPARLFLELQQDSADMLEKATFATFKVVNKNYVSHQ